MYGIQVVEMPQDIRDKFERSQRFEWFALLYILSAVFVLYLAKGASQAMKTAYLKAILGLIPGTIYLLTARIANRPPNRRFAWGYHGAYTMGYALAAATLLGMGAFMFIDSSDSLLNRSYPTIPTVDILGVTVWSGWPMIAALLWSAVPAFFLGRSTKSTAETVRNKLLLADAEMQIASFSSGVAAIVGILGVGLGWWWADAVAAIFISFSILKDGFMNVRRAFNDALDQVPTNVRGDDVEPKVKDIEDCFASMEWIERASVRLRESGEAILVEATVIPKDGAALLGDEISSAREEVHNIHWCIQRVVIMPVDEFDQVEEWLASPPDE
ncbi:MAG: cation diffusion facilitator family transporter [Armatimonadota bacterium]